jgi:hypothetical protein
VLERLGTQRLLALFAAGWLLFNFPLLALWDHDATLWGLPLFPVALFVLWAVLIAVLAWVVEQGASSRANAGQDAPTKGD